jgi:hypothetical protein
MDDTQITEAPQNPASATDEQLLIDAWRAEQLRRIAALIGRGCPPELALEIAR